MALLNIIPDSYPILRKTSKRIRHVDEDFRKLVDDMYESMVENFGIGLAAIQVGVPRRMFIYEIPIRRIKGYESCEPGDGEIVERSENEETVVEAITESAAADEEEFDPGYTGEYTVCINPRIIEREGAIIDEEGCLSRAGWVAKVERSYKVTFEACDIEMKKFTRTVTGLEARCVQHEIDHLDGILFTDRCIEGSLRELTAEEIEGESEPADEEVQAEDAVGAADG